MKRLSRRTKPGAKQLKYKRAADLMRAGYPLMKMHTVHGAAWFIVPGGEVSDDVALKLIERVDVQPGNDGLFPGISQTFRITKASSAIGARAVGYRTSAPEQEDVMDVKKYLNGSFVTIDDLRDGPHREKVVSVFEGKFAKPNAKFESGDTLSLNATNLKTLIRAFGSETNNWIGAVVELYVGQVEYQDELQDSVLVKVIAAPAETSAQEPEPPPYDDNDIHDEASKIPF